MKSLAHEHDKAEILRRLRALRPDSPRRWGRMSVHQMVCHLADSFLVCLGKMPVTMKDLWIRRTALKWVALYLPLSWPPGIPTTPEIDQVRGGGTAPADFAKDVARVEGLMESFSAPTTRFEDGRHPLFGKMSHAAWLRWGYLHLDHHLRQFGV